MPEVPPKPRRRGCLFYGGITLVVFLVLVLGGILFGLHMLQRMVTTYTDTAPMALPQEKLPEPQLKQLERRLDAFRDAVQEGKPTPPLVLTAPELNSLIATETDLRTLRGKVHLAPKGDQLEALVSLPLDQTGFRLVRGRYLNGTGVFGVSLTNGVLRVSPESFIAKGRPLPDRLLQLVRDQNFAKNLNENPRSAAALSRLDTIQIKDGKVIITARADVPK
jgi:hypothetical protein